MTVSENIRPGEAYQEYVDIRIVLVRWALDTPPGIVASSTFGVTNRIGVTGKEEGVESPVKRGRIIPPVCGRPFDS